MPVLEDFSAVGTIQTLIGAIKVTKSEDDMRQDEANFLIEFLGNECLKQLIKVQEQLEKDLERTDEQNNVNLCKEILTSFDKQADKDEAVKELCTILDGLQFRSLIETHDNVLFKTYATPPPSPSISPYHKADKAKPEPIRVIGLYRTSNEPLGITLSVDNMGNIYIARILHGSMIDRQGLLHVGDVIKEVNGKMVTGNPDNVQSELRKHTGSISLKVYPSYKDTSGLCQVFVKAHFDFDASKDKNIPCGEAGYSFKKGDILEIVDQSDANWWQARAVDGSCKTGIIPSQMFEENRRTRITPWHRESRVPLCGTTKSKKRKVMYSSTKNAAFDKLDIAVYEEVARMPPFERKTLILIGAPRVGRRTLKNKLLFIDPSRFGSAVAHTSRPRRSGEESGRGYYFLSKSDMQREINDGKFLEWGEYDNHLYGTKIDTVRNVMRSGKMCILDVNPTALKILKTAEFMPYVVFVTAPSIEVLRERNSRTTTGKELTEKDLQETINESRRLYDLYSHYFDLTLVNDNQDEMNTKLKLAIESLSTETQWVPVNWVY